MVPIRECNGPRERLHGTTCCESRGSRDDRFPGQVFLQCRGPNIGKKCTKKGDCDIACSCGDEDPRGGAEDPRAPKDGMLGLTGTCAGQLRVGVWMCQIDEQGKVTHMIVD